MKSARAHSILIFSIATNGYDRHFADFLGKQATYARELGADYWVADAAPPWGISAHDSAWLKIPLLCAGLWRGYDWVIYLDADCEMRTLLSPLPVVAGAQEDVFVCHDFSQRINSGVMIVRNTAAARRLLCRIWLSAFLPARLLPVEDRNSYENGHVIHFMKSHPAVRIIDGRWNWTTHDDAQDSFIHHYGGWSARPSPSQSLSKWRVWRRKAAVFFTALRLPLHGLFYLRRLPRPHGGDQVTVGAR